MQKLKNMVSLNAYFIFSSLCIEQYTHTHTHTHTHTEVAQSCPTLCDPMDCSPPGSSVHRILQARILEWVVIPFFGDLPNPGIEPGSPALQADSLPAELQGSPGSSIFYI